jgi:hypothetical protein
MPGTFPNNIEQGSRTMPVTTTTNQPIFGSDSAVRIVK